MLAASAWGLSLRVRFAHNVVQRNAMGKAVAKVKVHILHIHATCINQCRRYPKVSARRTKVYSDMQQTLCHACGNFLSPAHRHKAGYT